MKIVIPNRDIDDQDDTKEVSAIELDLDVLTDEALPMSPDFSVAVAKAAKVNAAAVTVEQKKEQRRQAVAMVEAGIAELRIKAKQVYDQTVGVNKPYAYTPKPKEAYELWKRVIPMFIEHPEILAIGPTQLAIRLNLHEANLVVTRDMLYAKLNDLAVKDLARFLKKLGDPLALKAPVSIRSVQQQLIERRGAGLATEVERFTGKFEIRCNTAVVNGKPYKIQLGASGKRRIKLGGKDWLPLDTLKAFCSGRS